MKKIIYFLAISAAALISCSKVELEQDMTPGLHLLIKMDGPATKATVTAPGVASLNENKLEFMNYFIFDGDTDAAVCLAKGTKEVGQDITESGIDVNLGYSEEEFDEIFKGGKYYFYVVANAKALFEGEDINTIPAIKSLVATIQNDGNKQDSFVMIGQSDNLVEVPTSSDKRRATVSVSLKRLVSKVSLKISLASEFSVGLRADGSPLEDGEDAAITIKWVPDPSSVNVEFVNLASNGVLGGNPSFVPTLFDFAEKTYSSTKEADGRYTCVSDIPYYTYPRTWSVADENKPTFLISVPWSSELIGEASFPFSSETKTSYYKLILSGSFESNQWNAFSVALEGLGSLTPSEAVLLEALELTVADWKMSVEGDSHFNTESSIQEARVLDVPQKEIVLYNQDEVTVPFVSSHDCIVSRITLKQMDFNAADIKLETIAEVTPETAMASITPSVTGAPNKTASINSVGRNLSFSHQLVNSLSQSSFDYRDYVYEVEICHAGAPSYKEVITITQKPAMSIEASKDNGGTVYVNGNHSVQRRWDTFEGDIPTSGNNSCPYMFVVSVSQFDDNKVIGDPRSTVAKTASELGISTPAAVTDGNGRRLTYYYGTDPAKPEVVAPKYRVSSAYGRLSGNATVSASTAIYRCASYQEEGRPAGRWRVPTEEELKFMGLLCAKQLIPALFYNNQSYWSASGRFRYNSNNGTFTKETSTSSCYVRCVYDEWYWENTDTPTVDVNTFTWGDQER